MVEVFPSLYHNRSWSQIIFQNPKYSSVSSEGGLPFF